MMDEHYVTNAWRNLFHGQQITPGALAKAESLLDSLGGESPLHLRLTNELDELRKLSAGDQSKPTKRRRTK
jgi:hypothetical protein